MKNCISRRKCEREPREGYAQTLQLSLLPTAKLNTCFWVLMSIISIGLTYVLQDNMMGSYLHGTLALGAIAIAIRNFIEFRRLKYQLNEMLKDHPEFKVH